MQHLNVKDIDIEAFAGYISLLFNSTINLKLSE